ncbi:uncharacterized protein BXZ73DRAFT_105996 [Epithele typhae]|uniref:uncharacterized protein n=1 Tax=Epithele typhae TaxID=378194 RepID=UPI00200771CB|nr:uncharacterized protein BXZ73DRAFT_105996 [Epithele typhae]KAH9915929.1 hypothetical protein BXZ73DRAFT_105996 [Epithele typhae]
MRKIAFAADGVQATNITDETGVTIFTVRAPYGFVQKTTTLRDSTSNIVGAWERNHGTDRITIREKTMTLSQWMPRFVAPNGQSYTWKRRDGASALKLVDDPIGSTVARAHRAYHGLRACTMCIYLDEVLSPPLDVLLLPFVDNSDVRLSLRMGSAFPTPAARLAPAPRVSFEDVTVGLPMSL